MSSVASRPLGSPALRAAALAAGIALLVRLLCAPFGGLILTQDSPSYLRIAADLGSGRGFSDPRLGVLRLPGYPLFLALVEGISPRGPLALRGAQAALGLLLAAACAFVVTKGSNAGRGLLAGVAVALLPIPLALENAVMSEALAGTLAMTALAAIVAWALEPTSPLRAAAAGALAAAALLTRLNLAPLLVAALAAALLAAGRHWRARRHRRHAALVAVAVSVLAGSLIAGPWLARNWVRLGSPAPLVGAPRVRLVYAMQAGLIPTELLARRVPEANLRAPNLPMEVFWRLVERGEEGISTARATIAEARARNPAGFRDARMATLARLLGFAPSTPGDVESWLLADRLATEGSSARLRQRAGRYLDLPSAPGMPHAASWARLARLETRSLRPLLVVLAFTALLVRAFAPGRSRRPVDPGLAALWLGILATLWLHASVLASYDRFAALLDPLWIVAILWSLPGNQGPGAARLGSRT